MDVQHSIMGREEVGHREPGQESGLGGGQGRPEQMEVQGLVAHPEIL